MATLNEIEKMAVEEWKRKGLAIDVIARKVLASRYEREYFEIYEEVRGNDC